MKIQDYKEQSKLYGVGGSGLFQLADGENKIRLLSEFEPFIQHFISSEKRFINCDGKACQYCKAKINRSSRVVAYILDRNDNRIKIAKFPWAVYIGCGDLSQSSEWGFTELPPYDLLITKKGEGKATRYSVNATRNEKALTIEQRKELEGKKSLKEIVENWRQKNRNNELPPPIEFAPSMTAEDISEDVPDFLKSE